MASRIKKIITREAIIFAIFIVCLFLIALIGTINKYSNFCVMLGTIGIICYPVYLMLRLIAEGVSTVKTFKGLGVVAIICFLESITSMIFGWMVMRYTSHLSKAHLPPIFYFIMILYIICGIGILRLKIWVLYFTIFMFIYQFVNFLPNIGIYTIGMANPAGYNLIHKIFNGSGSGIILLMNTLIPIICIFYLARHNVRKRFR